MTINFDKYLKDKILLYKEYIKPYYDSSEKVEIELSKESEELLKELSKTLEIDENSIFEALVYYQLLDEKKKEDKKLMSIYDLLEKIKNKEEISGTLYLTDKVKYKINKF